MAHTKTGEFEASRSRLVWPMNGMAALVAAARRRWRARATLRTIAELSPDQLNDIGRPEAPRPILDVKAGLIANLMSMR